MELHMRTGEPNRKIIGYSTSVNKDFRLIFKAFSRIKGYLSDIQIFHNDRGNEFKNNVIEGTSEAFWKEGSLRRKSAHMTIRLQKRHSRY